MTEKLVTEGGRVRRADKLIAAGSVKCRGHRKGSGGGEGLTYMMRCGGDAVLKCCTLRITRLPLDTLSRRLSESVAMPQNHATYH